MHPVRLLNKIIGNIQLCFNIRQVTLVVAKVHWCNFLLILLHMNWDFDLFWDVNLTKNGHCVPLKAYSCMFLYVNVCDSLLFFFLTEAGFSSTLGPLNCLFLIKRLRGADVIGSYWGSHQLHLLILQSSHE